MSAAVLDLARVGESLKNVVDASSNLRDRDVQMPDEYVEVSEASLIGFQIKDGRVLRAFFLDEPPEAIELLEFYRDGVRFVPEVHPESVSVGSLLSEDAS